MPLPRVASIPVWSELPGLGYADICVYRRQADTAADIHGEALELLELLIEEEVDLAGDDLERSTRGAEAPTPVGESPAIKAAETAAVMRLRRIFLIME